LVDIDLTILGAGPDDFERFEQQIRREYAHVADIAYRQGRSRVLQTFLSRPQLYNTSAIGELLESRARINLERRIATLSSEGLQQ
jgi:predicted metal-dependent HD superfamily phosphohydrolase